LYDRFEVKYVKIPSMARANLNQRNAYKIDPVSSIPYFHPFSVGGAFNPYKTKLVFRRLQTIRL